MSPIGRGRRPWGSDRIFGNRSGPFVSARGRASSDRRAAQQAGTLGAALRAGANLTPNRDESGETWNQFIERQDELAGLAEPDPDSVGVVDSKDGVAPRLSFELSSDGDAARHQMFMPALRVFDEEPELDPARPRPGIARAVGRAAAASLRRPLRAPAPIRLTGPSSSAGGSPAPFRRTRASVRNSKPATTPASLRPGPEPGSGLHR